jgi:superfamily II DNA helicase RecQ
MTYLIQCADKDTSIIRRARTLSDASQIARNLSRKYGVQADIYRRGTEDEDATYIETVFILNARNT